MGELSGKRVVITGGSSGIGLASAVLFAREGAHVALIARSRAGLDAAAERIGAQGSRAHVFAADVAVRDQVERAIGEAAAALGGIDVLVSNAAAAAYGPFTEMAADDFDRTVAITFGGAVNAIRAALPELERSRGTLIATVSIVARTPAPMQSPYSAAKHALRGFLGALRMELRAAGSGVDVCMVHPSPIDTPFWAHETSERSNSPKPLRSTYSAEAVAATIVECAKRPRTEVTVGGSGALLNAAWTLARPLAELALRTYGIAGQADRRPAPSPGSLWEPSGEGEISGGYGGRPSVYTALRMAVPRLLRPPKL
jgi:short-subunit dehydrogenase